MGNQQSIAKAVNDIINECITNVLIENSANCVQNTSSNQEINISGIDLSGTGCSLEFKDIGNTASINTNIMCSQANQNESELVNKIKSEIDNKVKAALEGFAGALNSQAITDTKNKIKNEIITDINIKNIINSVQNTVAKQRINMDNIRGGCPEICRRNMSFDDEVKYRNAGILKDDTCKIGFSNIKNNLVLSAVSSLTSNNRTINKISNDLANKLVNVQESVNKGVDLMSLLLFLLIPFIIFGGSFGLSLKYFKEIVPFLGIFPFVGGIVMLIIYLTTKPKMERTVENKPFHKSSCNYNPYKSEKVHYQKAIDTCLNDNNCVAVDIIYETDTKGEPKEILTTLTKPFNIIGDVIYYDNAPYICDEEPQDDKKKYYTVYKNVRNNTMLISSILLIIIGIIYTGVVLVLYTEKKN